MRQILTWVVLAMAVIFSNSMLQAGDLSAYGYIPVAAYAPGDLGTFWRTDLYVQNLTNQAIVIGLLFYSSDGTYTTSVSYQFLPLETKEFPNAVQNLFFYQGSGWILADASSIYNPGNPDDSLLGIYSRTYTVKEGVGSFGQGIDNQYPVPWGPKHFWGIQNNADYRTNIGITTIWSAVHFTIEYYDNTGALVDSVPLEVPAASNVQFRITQNIDNGSVIVWPEEDYSYMAYISRVDNASGDAIFIPGSAPASWTAKEQDPATMIHGVGRPIR